MMVIICLSKNYAPLGLTLNFCPTIGYLTTLKVSMC